MKVGGGSDVCVGGTLVSVAAGVKVAPAADGVLLAVTVGERVMLATGTAVEIMVGTGVAVAVSVASAAVSIGGLPVAGAGVAAAIS